MRQSEEGRQQKRRRMNPFALAVSMAILVAFASAPPAYAIDNPNTISIESVRAYDSVLEDDDLLVIVQYNLAYASLPDEVITDAFIGRFKRGTTELNSVEPFAFNDKGYGRGIFSLYWTPTQKGTDSIEFNNPNGENYTLTLQGDVAVFTGSVPTTTTATIEYRDSSDTANRLFNDIKALAQKFENDTGWNDDPDFASLVTIEGGLDQFTSVGEEYFSNAVANLNVMIPSLFSAGRTTPDFEPAETNRSFEDSLNTFWDGTVADQGFDDFAAAIEAPRAVLTTLAALLGMALVTFVTARWLSDTGLGVPFGVLTNAVTLPLATAVNLMPLDLALVVGFLCLVALGWALFARRG